MEIIWLRKTGVSSELFVMSVVFLFLFQTKSGLKTVTKESCKENIHIVTSAIEEICLGLQYDLDPEEQLSWQQKIHAVLFYNLVRRTYQSDRVGYLAFSHSQGSKNWGARGPGLVKIDFGSL